jgi:hypothetical protein
MLFGQVRFQLRHSGFQISDGELEALFGLSLSLHLAVQ